MAEPKHVDPRTDPMLREAPELEGFKVLEPCALYATVGRGGMGVVFRGKHLNLDVDVAVKCLHPALALEAHDELLVLEREARAAARIKHPNVVGVYDVRQTSGLHYLVMEYVEGETTRQRVQRKGPLAVGEAYKILLGAARGPQ